MFFCIRYGNEPGLDVTYSTATIFIHIPGNHCEKKEDEQKGDEHEEKEDNENNNEDDEDEYEGFYEQCDVGRRLLELNPEKDFLLEKN